jgi:YebC/PmpR family DNA-binding regulatory protein
MAGHSHWAGIKHKKGAADKKRGKAFGKFSKAIMIAAREGGGDPAMNLALRYAIDRARAGNMPKDVIERAIKKATGELGDVQYVEILYEGYAVGGVAVMVEVVTDNRNRTAPEMRRLFSESGGNLANPGAVKFQFVRKGLIALASEGVDFDEVFEIAAEAGADDVEQHGDTYGVTTPPTEFLSVKEALTAKAWDLTTAELAWVPENMVEPPASAVERIEKLFDKLDDHDDVQNVYSNYQPPGE